MTTTPRFLFALAMSTTLLADAAPAPWFQWRSLADGSLVCSQTPLGPGWEKSGGPYRDPHCEKRMSAK